jgi:hypothetical protein
MQEYTKKFHELFLAKLANKDKSKVATVRLRDDAVANDKLLDVLCKLESDGYSISMSVKGKTSLPSFIFLRGFELEALKPAILTDAHRSLVVFDIMR